MGRFITVHLTLSFPAHGSEETIKGTSGGDEDSGKGPRQVGGAAVLPFSSWGTGGRGRSTFLGGGREASRELALGSGSSSPWKGVYAPPHHACGLQVMVYTVDIQTWVLGTFLIEDKHLSE